MPVSFPVTLICLANKNRLKTTIVVLSRARFDPLTTGAAYIRVFVFYLHDNNYVEDKMWHQPARFENSSPPFGQIWNNFHSLEVVDRVSETQLQVGENLD